MVPTRRLATTPETLIRGSIPAELGVKHLICFEKCHRCVRAGRLALTGIIEKEHKGNTRTMQVCADALLRDHGFPARPASMSASMEVQALGCASTNSMDLSLV